MRYPAVTRKNKETKPHAKLDKLAASFNNSTEPRAYTEIVNNQMQPKDIGLSIVRNTANRIVRFKLSLPQGFSLNNSSEIAINIYEPSGRLIKTIDHTTLQPYSLITWDGTNNSGTQVKAGVYFVEAVVNGSRVSKKFIFVQ